MTISVVDAFDLPEWVGVEPVTWNTSDALDSGAHLAGRLRGRDGLRQPLDLLAVDAAFPVPVCPDDERRAVHQAWRYGEVALLDIDGRVAAGVPGSSFTADLVCEALRRVARSVGAPAGTFTVAFTL